MELSPKKNINFDNTEIAFQHQSNAALNQGYWLFKIISSNFLTKIGPPIANFMLNIGFPIKWAIKATIFKHFCVSFLEAMNKLATKIRNNSLLLDELFYISNYCTLDIDLNLKDRTVVYTWLYDFESVDEPLFVYNEKI